ncbi:hypothetical protein A1O3_02227 [Capronia epimyces CBS 606.96]|uniref:RING-type domain-containing protein n=1 Tax=Capronia epimyces CBS 606.96 TaxID=1182542 RepID=W9Y9E6_9EURO|nr:uncharacterized protein A1O3_02227 [Capronia epimyces CBS 606.96]EXJ89163.1 hypothetical protein A1O3_02227 [Capronia epimyces CBS 606.96]
MAATEPPTTGLLNLEKELVCFICTEVLYQPLTLLDCLHTFCGSCLKEWFSHQHRKALHAHSSVSTPPYTCPTCRAPVKDVQHNAMINTLLDMFLAANPGKDRTTEEKAEMAQIYKAGDEILPKLESHRRRERRRREEEEGLARERRSASHVPQDRSRRDQQLYNASTDTGLTPHPRGGDSRSRERRDRTERSRDADRHERRQHQQNTEAMVSAPRTASSPSSAGLSSSLSPPTGSPRHPDAVEARQRGARTVAHQASLISLVSASESGTGTGDSLNEAQLMQEILAEGLLDGINVEDLTEAEQDELSELIAERYRQLHPERMRRAGAEEARAETVPNETRQPEVQIEEADRHPRQSSRSTQRQQAHPSPRSSRSVTIGGTDGRPPSAFPQPAAEQTLTLPQGATHRRRASNESGRRETSATRTRITSPSSGSRNAPAARSATDLSDRPQSIAFASERRPQVSHTTRSNTEPRASPRASEVWQSAGRQVSSPPQLDSPTVLAPRTDEDPPVMSSVNTAPVPTSIPMIDPAACAPEPLASVPTTVSTRFQEPSIKCARCARPNIQYEVHKHCSSCKLDLCLRCYRAGRGCNHWYGFGHAAMFKFEASQPLNRNSQPIELPHLLIGRRYQRPPASTSEDEQRNVVTSSSDAVSRLQEGSFCDRCGSFANDYFWSCDYCNDGEWGFCNDCVNTNHCCKHPLLPVARKPIDPRPTASRPGTAGTETGTHSLSPFNTAGRVPSPAQSAPSSTTSANGAFPKLRADFAPLVITINCDICARPVSPEEIWYHCPGHPTPSAEKPDQKGDFDICSTCYHSFVKTGQIKRDDGPDGWRLCPSGHRMISVTFEQERDEGQRRVILRDLVGGAKMTEADMVAWKITNTQLSSNSIQRAADPTATAATTGRGGQWVWREDSSGTRRATRARAPTLPSSAPSSTRLEFPPDGGVGKVCRSRWSYYPEEGKDGEGELMFPKHAEIHEVEDINEDWSFGVYAGDMGVFPAVYVR